MDCRIRDGRRYIIEILVLTNLLNYKEEIIISLLTKEFQLAVENILILRWAGGRL